MTSIDKYEVEVSFNLKTSKNNIMHTFFHSNISKFAGNFQGMLNEGTCKTTIQNMYELGQNAKLFKSDDVSMLVHGCGVSQYTQFYDRFLKTNVTTSVKRKLLW